MTRTDLEEAIGNLEYLVLNYYDPVKAKEYCEQLEELRRELLVLDRTYFYVTATPLHFPSRHTDARRQVS